MNRRLGSRPANLSPPRRPGRDDAPLAPTIGLHGRSVVSNAAPLIGARYRRGFRRPSGRARWSIRRMPTGGLPSRADRRWSGRRRPAWPDSRRHRGRAGGSVRKGPRADGRSTANRPLAYVTEFQRFASAATRAVQVMPSGEVITRFVPSPDTATNRPLHR